MSEVSREIAELIRQGNKIEAIKLLRETTGLGLKEAKDEIDRLSDGVSGLAASPGMSGAEAGSRSCPISKEVEELAREGKKIQAIKLLREQTGLGLKEAKERIEEVTGRSGGGCLPALLLMILVGIMILVEGSGI